MEHLQLSTVVLLWRQSLEFVVDVIDTSDTTNPYTSSGDLIIYIRPAQSKGSRSKITVAKKLYWQAACSSERRILEEVWKEWLEERLNDIMEDVPEIDTRSQGKDYAYSDLMQMLKERDEKNDGWRTSSSKKQRGEAWHQRESDQNEDKKKRLAAIHELMLREVAHRWLEITVTTDRNQEGLLPWHIDQSQLSDKNDSSDNDRSSDSKESKESKESSESNNNQNNSNKHELQFTVHLKPPINEIGSKLTSKRSTTSLNRKNAKLTKKEDKFNTPRFAHPGSDGFHNRQVFFRAKKRALDEDLKIVAPLLHGAKEYYNKAHDTIDRACLTEKELEKARKRAYEKLEQERLEAGYSMEQRLTIFLCSCRMSKNESRLIENKIGYDDLPRLNDQMLLEMNLIGMKNMLARRKFLAAIVVEFGKGVVDLKKEDVFFQGSSSEEEEEDSSEEEEDSEEEEEEDHRF